MTRAFGLLALSALLLGAAAPAARWPDQGGFAPLFDGRSLEGWVVENSDGRNFTVTAGVLRVEGPQGWLRSAGQYGDFVLRAEFRFLTDDADSGLFVRAPGPASNVFIRGWPANAYQVQVRNMATNQTNQPLWIGHLYRHRVAPGETAYDADAARAAFRPTGEWQTIEATVAGETISVVVNGVPTTRAAGVVNPRGHIGVQGETGIVEYRTIAIRTATAVP
jgi:hypothetical protein